MSDQPETMVKQSVRVPKELYDWTCDNCSNFSDGVRKGLTLLRDSHVIKSEIQIDQTSLYANAILDLQSLITGTLKSQLDIKDRQIDELHGQLDRQAALIKRLIDEPKALPAPKSRTLWQMLTGKI